MTLFGLALVAFLNSSCADDINDLPIDIPMEFYKKAWEKSKYKSIRDNVHKELKCMLSGILLFQEIGRGICVITKSNSKMLKFLNKLDATEIYNKTKKKYLQNITLENALEHNSVDYYFTRGPLPFNYEKTNVLDFTNYSILVGSIYIRCGLKSNDGPCDCCYCGYYFNYWYWYPNDQVDNYKTNSSECIINNINIKPFTDKKIKELCYQCGKINSDDICFNLGENNKYCRNCAIENNILIHCNTCQTIITHDEQLNNYCSYCIVENKICAKCGEKYDDDIYTSYTGICDSCELELDHDY